MSVLGQRIGSFFVFTVLHIEEAFKDFFLKEVHSTTTLTEVVYFFVFALYGQGQILDATYHIVFWPSHCVSSTFYSGICLHGQKVIPFRPEA